MHNFRPYLCFITPGSSTIIGNVDIVVEGGLCALAGYTATSVGSGGIGVGDFYDDQMMDTFSVIFNFLIAAYDLWNPICSFLSTLLDTNKEIVSFASYCLVNVLAVRHPTIFFASFLEVVYRLNEVGSIYLLFGWNVCITASTNCDLSIL